MEGKKWTFYPKVTSANPWQSNKTDGVTAVHKKHNWQHVKVRKRWCGGELVTVTTRRIIHKSGSWLHERHLLALLALKKINKSKNLDLDRRQLCSSCFTEPLMDWIPRHRFELHPSQMVEPSMSIRLSDSQDKTQLIHVLAAPTWASLWLCQCFP